MHVQAKSIKYCAESKRIICISEYGITYQNEILSIGKRRKYNENKTLTKKKLAGAVLLRRLSRVDQKEKDFK